LSFQARDGAVLPMRRAERDSVMGGVEKKQNQDSSGQSEQDGDKSAFGRLGEKDQQDQPDQLIGDDKGEGGQQDIKTDSIETNPSKQG